MNAFSLFVATDTATVAAATDNNLILCDSYHQDKTYQSHWNQKPHTHTIYTKWICRRHQTENGCGRKYTHWLWIMSCDKRFQWLISVWRKLAKCVNVHHINKLLQKKEILFIIIHGFVPMAHSIFMIWTSSVVDIGYTSNCITFCVSVYEILNHNLSNKMRRRICFLLSLSHCFRGFLSILYLIQYTELDGVFLVDVKMRWRVSNTQRIWKNINIERKN